MPHSSDTDSAANSRDDAAPGEQDPRTHSHLGRDLRLISADGVCFSVMVGIGETYLAAFALALGKSELICGLVASVPMLVGAVLQLISPWAIRHLKSNRRWIVCCATLQSLAFLPLAAGAFRGMLPTWALYSSAAIYWGAGLATGPAWNTWVETLVPAGMRSKYFGMRARLAQAGILVGLVSGGIALQLGRAEGIELRSFGVMFLIAGMFRFVSSRCLAAQSEPIPLPVPSSSDGFLTADLQAPKKRRLNRGTKQLLVYLITMQIAVQFSGPYFAPYMLKQLSLSYAEYMSLIAAAFGARIVVAPLWGRIAQRLGPKRLLWIGAIGICPLPAMWLISDIFWYLIVLQIYSGICWAAHELGMLLMCFETIPRNRRTKILTWYNFGHALATAVGAALGALVLFSFGQRRETYLLLFAGSAVLRCLPLMFLLRLPLRIRAVLPIAVRIIGVRPGSGSMDRPIVSSVNGETFDEDSVSKARE